MHISEIDQLRERLRDREIIPYKRKVWRKFGDMCLGSAGIVLIELYLLHTGHAPNMLQTLAVIACGGYSGVSCSQWVKARTELRRKKLKWELEDAWN